MTTLSHQLDDLFARQSALKAANLALVQEVQSALLADTDVPADVWSRYEAYCAESWTIARAICALVKRGSDAPAADPLEAAASDTALTRDLVKAAADVGFTLETDSAWTDSFTRQGVLIVRHHGVELRRIAWDVGSGRAPAATYRRGSRHHLAVVDALRFIAARAPLVFAGY